MIEIINKPLLLHLVGYLYYWQKGFNSVFKGLINRESRRKKQCCHVLKYYYSDHHMHNIYVYINILYIVSTPICLDASASSSWSLILLLCLSYKIIKIMFSSRRKHQHRVYTNKTVQIVYTATKLKTSTCCNYNC